MNFEQTLEIIDRLLVRVRKKGLNEAEKTILEGTWNGHSFEEMAGTSSYTLNYLQKNVGPKLWNLLSVNLSQSINKQNLREFFESQDLENFSQNLCINDFEIVNRIGDFPDISDFIGREEELKVLEKVLVGNPLMAIYGPGGVGKSFLLAYWIQTRLDKITQWRTVLWISVYVDSIPELIKYILSKLGLAAPSTDNLIPFFYNFIDKNNILICIDSIDDFVNHPKNWSDNREFIRKISETTHLSSFVLLGRESFSWLRSLRITPIKLSGFSLEDGAKFLIKQGLQGKDYQSIVSMYSGNPLSLRIISSYIKDYFDGEIDSFRTINTVFLCLEIENVLEQQFKKVSASAVKLIKYIVISYYKDSILNFTLSQLSLKFDDSLDTLIRSIKELEEKSFLVKTVSEEALWSVPPVIRKFVFNALIESEAKYDSVH